MAIGGTLDRVARYLIDVHRQLAAWSTLFAAGALAGCGASLAGSSQNTTHLSEKQTASLPPARSRRSRRLGTSRPFPRAHRSPCRRQESTTAPFRSVQTRGTSSSPPINGRVLLGRPRTSRMSCGLERQETRPSRQVFRRCRRCRVHRRRQMFNSDHQLRGVHVSTSGGASTSHIRQRRHRPSERAVNSISGLHLGNPSVFDDSATCLIRSRVI